VGKTAGGGFWNNKKKEIAVGGAFLTERGVNPKPNGERGLIEGGVWVHKRRGTRRPTERIRKSIGKSQGRYIRTIWFGGHSHWESSEDKEKKIVERISDSKESGLLKWGQKNYSGFEGGLGEEDLVEKKKRGV